MSPSTVPEGLQFQGGSRQDPMPAGPRIHPGVEGAVSQAHVPSNHTGLQSTGDATFCRMMNIAIFR